MNSKSVELVEDTIYLPYLEDLFESLLDRSSWCPLMKEFITSINKPIWEIWYSSFQDSEINLLRCDDAISLFTNPSRNEELLIHYKNSARGKLFAIPESEDKMVDITSMMGCKLGEVMRTIITVAKDTPEGLSHYFKKYRTDGHFLYHYVKIGILDFLDINKLFSWWNDFLRPFDYLYFEKFTTKSGDIIRHPNTFISKISTNGENELELIIHLKDSGCILEPIIQIGMSDNTANYHLIHNLTYSNDTLLEVYKNLNAMKGREGDISMVFNAQRICFIDDILTGL